MIFETFMTDDIIKKLSNGEVNEKDVVVKIDKDGNGAPGTLLDPKIFGDVQCNPKEFDWSMFYHKEATPYDIDIMYGVKGNQNFGHIDVGCGFVNPACYQIISILTRIPSSILKEIAYCKVLLSVTETLEDTEFELIEPEAKTNGTIYCGADAIEWLLMHKELLAKYTDSYIEESTATGLADTLFSNYKDRAHEKKVTATKKIRSVEAKVKLMGIGPEKFILPLTSGNPWFSTTSLTAASS